MTGCELVVATHYESHETSDSPRDDPGDKRLEALVTDNKNKSLFCALAGCWKGWGVNVGDLLSAELRHWYSVETRPTGDFGGPLEPDGVLLLLII